jgi:ribosome biogenesis GTPase
MHNQNSDIQMEGIVVKKNLGQYEVNHDNINTTCVLSANLWKALETSASPDGQSQRVVKVNQVHMDPVAVGDIVSFISTPDGPGMIQNVLPRVNYLARASAKPMPGAHAFEQIIAANIDQVVPVFAAADPEPKWNLLDRYLVSSESYDIPSVIVITKVDLLNLDDETSTLMNAVNIYRQIGYKVVLTSAKENDGVEELKAALQGKRSILVGKSGVGKTTLLNTLEPGLGLRVKAVSQTTGKGRHTTTHLEMFPLTFGGEIIDTPGVREFGLYDLDPEDLVYLFPEMRPFIGHCKFGLSCQHEDKPGCAIRQGVMDGKISPYRFKSYLRLKADM